jgi:hypothetical protein
MIEVHGTQDKGGRLELSSEVVEELRGKHPQAAESSEDVLIPGVPPELHHAIFDGVTTTVIKKAFLQTSGSGGVSGGDAAHWKRAVSSFKGASSDLVEVLAEKTRLLCTEYLDPSTLGAYVNNRLVALDKAPGVRPVGIGELERRAIGKAVLSVLSQEVIEAAGVDQMCAGQPAACETVLHAMKRAFENEAADGLLLVDADNAFNRLKRMVALLNMRHICPSLSVILINCYRAPASLFVAGGLELRSEEGVTQGDPLAMVMYGLALLPLIKEIRPGEGDRLVQSWYADDGQAVGRCGRLRKWWDELVALGPEYGYYPRPNKTVLVVKRAEQRQEAEEAFAGTGVRIAGPDEAGDDDAGGARDLGAAIGSDRYRREFVEAKVARWAGEVQCLSSVAKFQPHAAHALLIHGLKHRWTYIQRCMGEVGDAYAELERVLRDCFIPALFGESEVISDRDREIYALPARLGGLSIDSPVMGVESKHTDSKELTASVQESILAGGGRVNMEAVKEQRKRITNRRKKLLQEKAQQVQDSLPEGNKLRKALQVASEKGASSVFSVRPSEEFGFVFTGKRDYRDLLSMRYAKAVKGLTSICACGVANSVCHSQQCPKGGFINQRHNEMAELWGYTSKKLFRDVQVEPSLQAMEGEELEYKSAITSDEARSDVRVRGFWGNERDAFFDFRVFYPFVTTHYKRSLPAVYKSQSLEKKRQYEERINKVDNGSFTPMIMSSFGGMGPEMSIALKYLAARLAEKEGSEYSVTVGVLRARFSFAAARTSLVCLRGSRALFSNRRFRRNVDDYDAPIALVAAEL